MPARGAVSRPRPPHDAYPRFRKSLPPVFERDGPYVLRFAQDAADLEAVQRLRYAVFNLELDEGLDEAHATGRDADPFDAVCHHLMLIDDRSGRVVGTYRLQTNEMAARALGFYSAVEFDLAALPAGVQAESVEIGRACLAADHRSLKGLYLLWRGLGRYLAHNRKRYLFGCCSLTSQDAAEGEAVYGALAGRGRLQAGYTVLPRTGYALPPVTPAQVEAAPARIPRLMQAYLSLGAEICSRPAIDRAFKTIDYLALLDVTSLDERTQRFFVQRS